MSRDAWRLRDAIALFRLGASEALAYRASMFIWVLTTSFPLVSLALWSHLAESGTIGGYDAAGFTGYFVCAFVVRQASSSWVVWDLDRQIRSGDLSPLLLRPTHPVLHHIAVNLAALPLRLLVALPIAIAVWWWAEGRASDHLSELVLVPIAIAGAWAINFAGQLAVGCLAFWFTRSSSLYEIWIGVYIVLSGYTVPTSLFPGAIADVARLLPFHAALGFPVELATGALSSQAVLHGFGVQAIWLTVLSGLAALAWTRGVRQYGAVGA